MVSLRCRREHQGQIVPANLTQEQACDHFRISPGMPDTPPVLLQKRQSPHGNIWHIRRQARPGGDNINLFRLNRDQSGNCCRHTRQPAFQVWRDDLNPVDLYFRRWPGHALTIHSGGIIKKRNRCTNADISKVTAPPRHNAETPPFWHLLPNKYYADRPYARFSSFWPAEPGQAREIRSIRLI